MDQKHLERFTKLRKWISANLDRVLVWIIWFAAIVPRMWGLGSRPFNNNEAAVSIYSEQSFSRLMDILRWGSERFVAFSVKYALVMHLLNPFHFTSAWWLRLWPLMFGLAAIAVAFRAALLLLPDRRTALTATLLLAASPFHIMFSRTVGPEALLFLLCAAALFFFLKIFLGKAGTRDYILYFATMFLAINLHIVGGIILLPFQILFFTCRVKTRDDIKSWLAANLPLILLFAVWLTFWRAMLMDSMQNAPASQMMGILDKNLMTREMIFQTMFLEVYFQLIFTLSNFFTGAMFNYFTLCAVILAPLVFHVGIFYGFREYEGGLRFRTFYLVMIGFTATAAGMMLMSGISMPVALIPCYIVFYCLVTGGILRFGGARMARWFPVTVALLFFGGWTAIHREENAAADWRRMAAVIRQADRDNAPIIVPDGWDSIALSHYLGGQSHALTALFPDFAIRDVSGSNNYLQNEIVQPLNGYFDTTGEFLPKALARHSEIWLVFRINTDKDASQVINDYKFQIKQAELRGILQVRERRFSCGAGAREIKKWNDNDEPAPELHNAIVLLRVRRAPDKVQRLFELLM